MIPYDKREGKIWYNNDLVDWQDVKLHVLNNNFCELILCTSLVSPQAHVIVHLRHVVKMPIFRIYMYKYKQFEQILGLYTKKNLQIQQIYPILFPNLPLN